MPSHIEIVNHRRTVRGRPINYAGPFPGFRVVEFLGFAETRDGTGVRVRYLGPDFMEEVVPASKVTGVVENGTVDRDPDRARDLMEGS